MENTAITKQQAKAHSHEVAGTDSELYKLGSYVTAAFAGALGIWALVCLSSAMISTGGPLALIKSLFSAISGS